MLFTDRPARIVVADLFQQRSPMRQRKQHGVVAIEMEQVENHEQHRRVLSPTGRINRIGYVHPGLEGVETWLCAVESHDLAVEHEAVEEIGKGSKCLQFRKTVGDVSPI